MEETWHLYCDTVSRPLKEKSGFSSPGSERYDNLICFYFGLLLSTFDEQFSYFDSQEYIDLQKLLWFKLFLAHCITDSTNFDFIPNMPIFVKMLTYFSFKKKFSQNHDFYDAHGDEKRVFLWVA